MNMSERALRIAEEMLGEAEDLKINVHKASCGATVIDGGVEVKGSFEAGLQVARICLGGLAEVSLSTMDYAGLTLPMVNVSTDYPTIATMGSQLADWEVAVSGYHALGSGPARALAPKRELPRGVSLKRGLYERSGYRISNPMQVYERIGYAERSESAVIILEASALPTEDVLTYIADTCGVKPKNVYAVVTPTSSITGSVQIAGRVVEVGIHKLGLLDFDLKKIVFGSGHAPVAPVHPRATEAMGRVNDAIRYAGVVYYKVDYEDERTLKAFVDKVPASNSKNYHKPFAKVFEEVNYDFYSIDLGTFAPAVITLNNLRDGATLTGGYVNPPMLRQAFGVQ